MQLNTQAILKTLIKEEFPSLSAFAKCCGVSQSLVWRDCEDRQISDKRFLAYLKALSKEGKESLARARIRDIFTDEFASLVEVRSSSRPKEKNSNLEILPKKSQEALDRLAGEMAKDAELHDWIMLFVKKVC